MELVSESVGNLLAIKVREGLTDQDYAEVFIPHLDWIVEKYGKARLLFSMEGYAEDVRSESPWAPSRFSSRHREKIEKIAFIGELRWETWAQTVGDLLDACEVKVFPYGMWEKALNWINC